MSIPRPLRTLALRAAMSNPTWFKRFGGTVGLSSIGMFGAGGGWGIPIAPPTLMITVGGIATKPRYVDGNLEPRELLDITISVDHAIVDGATAARFTRRLAELLEHPVYLTDPLPRGDAGVVRSALLKEFRSAAYGHTHPAYDRSKLQAPRARCERCGPRLRTYPPMQ